MLAKMSPGSSPSSTTPRAPAPGLQTPPRALFWHTTAFGDTLDEQWPSADSPPKTVSPRFTPTMMTKRRTPTRSSVRCGTEPQLEGAAENAAHVGVSLMQMGVHVRRYRW